MSIGTILALVWAATMLVGWSHEARRRRALNLECPDCCHYGSACDLCLLMSKRHDQRGGTKEIRWRQWMRRQLVRRDGALCQLCQETMAAAEMTIDHITPVSKGGSDKAENLRLVHEGCNQERGAGFFRTSPIRREET